jgi:nicotinate-nucleotide--dimethylbenzimidazole phosphoribosyltransferase
MIEIKPLDKSLEQAIQATIDGKTKPIGALGQLETLAKRLQLIASQRARISITVNDSDVLNRNEVKLSLTKPNMLVFAGDHGINKENLSIAPSHVTRQMVLNFLHGGAAINCFCRSNQIALTVIDCGILTAISPTDIPEYSASACSTSLPIPPTLIEQRLGSGTLNFSIQAAMTKVQVEQGFAYAYNLVKQLSDEGVDVILLGEMGIANTSSAAAIMAFLTPHSVEQCVGRGTGISDEQLARKLRLIKRALQRISTTLPLHDASQLTEQKLKTLLSELGGFEIVQMVATILAAASRSIPIVIDGFIVSVAALVAARIEPNVCDYLIYAHVSKEKAHQLLLTELAEISQSECKPLLDLGLRLGEGTGAALAFPLLQAAASFYNDMASFTEAGVTV